MARVRKKGKNERDRKAKQEEDRDKTIYEQTIHEQTMHEQTMHDQIAYDQNQNRKNVIWYVLAGCVLEIVLEVFASGTVCSLLMGGGVAVLGGSVSFIASHAKPGRDKSRNPPEPLYGKKGSLISAAEKHAEQIWQDVCCRFPLAGLCFVASLSLLSATSLAQCHAAGHLLKLSSSLCTTLMRKAEEGEAPDSRQKEESEAEPEQEPEPIPEPEPGIPAREPAGTGGEAEDMPDVEVMYSDFETYRDEVYFLTGDYRITDWDNAEQVNVQVQKFVSSRLNQRRENPPLTSEYEKLVSQASEQESTFTEELGYLEARIRLYGMRKEAWEIVPTYEVEKLLAKGGHEIALEWDMTARTDKNFHFEHCEILSLHWRFDCLAFEQAAGSTSEIIHQIHSRYKELQDKGIEITYTSALEDAFKKLCICE